MDKEIFADILKNPLRTKEIDHSQFSGLVEDYPVFPVARVLEMLAAGNENPGLIADLLKKNAPHLINLNYIQWLIRKYNPENGINEAYTHNSENLFIEEFKPPVHQRSDEDEHTDEGLMAFDFKENKIAGMDLKSDMEAEEISILPEVENNRKSEIIERFIRTNPGSIRADENALHANVVIPEERDDESLITDTLAKIYVKQGLYSKAIYAYEKLILKNPEKNSYFAAQIEDIKKLINK